MYNFDGIDTFNKNYNATKIQEKYKKLRNHLKKVRSKQQLYSALKNISHELNDLNKSGLEFLGGVVSDTNILDDESIVKTLKHKQIKKILRQTVPPTRSKQQQIHNLKNLFQLFDYWMEDTDFNKDVDFDKDDVEYDNVVPDHFYNSVAENQNNRIEAQLVDTDTFPKIELVEHDINIGQNKHVVKDEYIGQNMRYVENDNFNIEDFERVYEYDEGGSDDISDIEIFAQNYIRKKYS